MFQQLGPGLIKHEQHKIRDETLTTMMTLPPSKDDVDFPVTMFKAFNQNFFEVGFQRNQNIYRWVYILSTPDKARNYQSCYTIEHPTDGKKIEWPDKVKSLFESHGQIIADEVCFTLRNVTAKRFTNEESHLEYSVKIRNLKEEAKDDEESGISDNDNSN